ncbi:MAG: hypothetical protein AABY00_01080 [Nanoarchaeota archaeon]
MKEDSREYFKSYRKQPSPWWKYLFLSILIFFFLFLAYGLYHLYVQLDNDNLRQKIMTLDYQNMKCVSLCPVIDIPEYSEIQNKMRFHDVACTQACADIYQNYTFMEFSKAFPHDRDYDDQFKANYNSWRQCGVNLSSNAQFNYISCYSLFFENLSRIVDLTSIRYISYQRYSFSIIDLRCDNPASITLRSDFLGGAGTTVLFTLTDKSGTSLSYRGFAAPFLGKNREYLVEYQRLEIKNLDSVGVAFLRADGKQVTPIITRSCFKK